jgi:hypothetical protein
MTHNEKLVDDGVELILRARLDQEVTAMHQRMGDGPPKREPAVPVSALRALLKEWQTIIQDQSGNWHYRQAYDAARDELAALCDHAEGKP